MMQPITTDTSDFEALRKAGQTYVDKTAHFHRLVTDANRKFFFLARPRRFGKSLAVTTLKSIFLGHRAFFKGLPIYLVGLGFDSKTRHLADAVATALD